MTTRSEFIRPSKVKQDLRTCAVQPRFTESCFCGTGNWKDKPRVYKHDNNTGRWITKFKAEWYPQEPGVFVCGSMKRPHGLDVFDASTTEHSIAGKLMSEYLSAIPARHAFHPEMDVLATGNASGRLCIWTTSRKLAP
mmetsp:Transcript_29306/g.113606  ORF Transcript_29306/g.113606 Transcript_29306/m.113606 type:complete len:138 (-) Transcript_29306:250-663(-)